MYKVACFSLKVLYWSSNLLCWCYYTVPKTMFSHRLSNECSSEIWAVLVNFFLLWSFSIAPIVKEKKEKKGKMKIFFLISEINHSPPLQKIIFFQLVDVSCEVESIFFQGIKWLNWLWLIFDCHLGFVNTGDLSETG